MILVRRPLTPEDHCYFPVINGLYARFVDPGRLDSDIFIYRSHDTPIRQFCSGIADGIGERRPRVVCGDFNIDIQAREFPLLENVFHQLGYMRLNREPTLMSGSTIDYIYTLDSLASSYESSSLLMRASLLR